MEQFCHKHKYTRITLDLRCIRFFFNSTLHCHYSQRAIWIIFFRTKPCLKLSLDKNKLSTQKKKDSNWVCLQQILMPYLQLQHQQRIFSTIQSKMVWKWVSAMLYSWTFTNYPFKYIQKDTIICMCLETRIPLLCQTLSTGLLTKH
jgi:hypothetical protein